MAGYSKTPLYKKLGYKENKSTIVVNRPDNYYSLLGDLPFSIVKSQTDSTNLDLLHYFAMDKTDLENDFAKLKNQIKKNGMVWISWPKKSSKVESDLTEDLVREIGLSNGLVDVKVCAIDETWSGLKFVYRVKDR